MNLDLYCRAIRIEKLSASTNLCDMPELHNKRGEKCRRVMDLGTLWRGRLGKNGPWHYGGTLDSILEDLHLEAQMSVVSRDTLRFLTFAAYRSVEISEGRACELLNTDRITFRDEYDEWCKMNPVEPQEKKDETHRA